MQYPVDWVDAFSDRPFGGNGCAVVHDAADLSDETCMAFVRETGLVECTFLGPSETADAHVRYFLAAQEIPFAGHPTLATAASMIDRGMVQGNVVLLQTGVGPIRVDIEPDCGAPVMTMTQNQPGFGPEIAADVVAAVGGLTAEDIAYPPQVVSTGLPFCVTVLRDQDALRRLTFDTAALDRFRAAVGGPEAGMMEPYWVTLQGADDAGQTFSRLLLAPPMPPEDPFTGSATGAMACYLWARGLTPRSRFVAQQGHWLGRPGRAEVEVLGPRDAIEGVRVGGRSHVLMRGALDL